MHGENQTLRLLEKVQSSELPRPTLLWASPKKRAQQSFQPLADYFHLPLLVQNDLDERQNNETPKDFRERIEKVLQESSAKEGVLYLCTHVDWLEEAMNLIPCDTDLLHDLSHWAPLQYLGLQFKTVFMNLIEQKRIPL